MPHFLTALKYTENDPRRGAAEPGCRMGEPKSGKGRFREESGRSGPPSRALNPAPRIQTRKGLRAISDFQGGALWFSPARSKG